MSAHEFDMGNISLNLDDARQKLSEWKRDCNYTGPTKANSLSPKLSGWQGEVSTRGTKLESGTTRADRSMIDIDLSGLRRQVAVEMPCL